jgi:hypothetical protein
MADYNSSGMVLPQIKDASVDNAGWFQSRAVGGKKTYKRRVSKRSLKKSRKNHKSRKYRKTSMKN